ncbi:MAG: cache domain-containing protein, partial [Candidatus Eisenbacteria bacterium]|nr:cache domain-containing protein [Candidatus Eisenbacteria bacterium]
MPAILSGKLFSSIRAKMLIGVVVPVILGMTVVQIVIMTGMESKTDGRLQGLRAQYEEAVASRLSAQVDLAIAAVTKCEMAGGSEAECLNLVKNLQYGSAYIWIHSYDPVDPTKPKMVMHPTVPKLDGTDISDFRDKKKFEKIAHDGRIFNKNAAEVSHIKETNLFVDMNAVVKAKGAGTVTYYWPKPKSGGGTTDEGYAKLSYVKLYPQKN